MRAIKRLGLIALILLGLGACVAIGVVAAPFVDFILTLNAAPQMARALAPPQYPGSQLVKTYPREGTESQGDWRTYRTSDSVDKVLAFMEEHMPGFTIGNDSIRGTVYRNTKEDRSDLAKRAADYSCSSLFCATSGLTHYPSASVIIYSDPDNSAGTLVDVLIDWPAP
jgi:hypothetical protein